MTAVEKFGVVAPGMFSNAPLKTDDEVLVITGNGAGYGNPFERDPALVLADVQDELLSVEQAKALFGVAISEKTLELDLAATEKLRAKGAA